MGSHASTDVARQLTSPTGILVLIPALVLLVAVVVAGAGIYALRTSLLDVADRSFDQAATHAAASLAARREAVEPLMASWHDWLADEGRTAPLERQATLLRALLVDRPTVARIGWHDAAGDYVGARRDGDGSITLLVRGADRLRAWRLGPDGREALGDQPTIERGDLFERPYWQAATTTEGMAWTDPYALAEGEVAVTAARVLRGADGKPLGVATIDFSLSSLSVIVADLSAACRGTVFLAAGDGTILAWPRPTDLPPATPGRLPTIDDLDEPAVPALLAAIADHGDGTRPVRFELDGEAWLGRIERKRLDPRRNWYVAAYAPAAAFLAPSRALLLQAAAVAVLGLAAALACAWLLARSINRHRSALRLAREAADSAEARVREMGSYDLLRKLGEGGMGEVWLGRHRLLARPAAVKLIPPGQLARLGGDEVETALERFEREARTTATLRSRNTVEIYDFGVAGDGTFFLVMELLEGLDLHQLVARHGPQPVGRVVAILRQACRSLAEAHDRDLVHRDIKPGNIFLCRRADEVDIVKVLDFGMALDRHRDPTRRLTEEGFVSGTPAYMSPEQARGHAVDHRSDLYSLGCVAYYLLTGHEVFERPTAMDQMLAHVHDPPPDPGPLADRHLPPALERVILDCLSKDPGARPQNARALESALAAIDLTPDQAWDAAAAREWWRCAECYALDSEDFARCAAQKRLARSRITAFGIQPHLAPPSTGVAVPLAPPAERSGD